MTNVGIYFEILDKDTPVPVGWIKTTGHLIWDVKWIFLGKHGGYSRVIARGNLKDPPMQASCHGKA